MKPYSRAKSLHLLEEQRWYTEHRRGIFFVLFVTAFFGATLFAVSTGLDLIHSPEKTSFAEWMQEHIGDVITIIVSISLLLFAYFRPDLWFKVRL